MKIVVPHKSFTNIFSTVASVCPSRTPKDILKCVLFRFGSNQGQLIASDTEIGLRCDLPEILVSQSGEALLPAERILPILNAVSGSELTLSMTPGAVEIACGTSRFKISLPDPADFPPFSDFAETESRTVDALALKRAIRRTAFCLDPLSTSYALNGVYFDFDDTQSLLTLVGCDAKRIAIANLQTTIQPGLPIIASMPIVPAKAVNVAEKMLGGGACEISVTPNDVIFRNDSAVLVAKQVRGKFPNYKRIIPQNEYMVPLVVGPLLDIVKQSMIVLNPETRAVHFCFGNGELKLETSSANVGNSTVSMPITYDGPETRISLDPKYIFDFLRVLDAGTSFELRLKDEKHGVLLSLTDYRYIAMPMAS